jgi:hypothetical protein
MSASYCASETSPIEVVDPDKFEAFHKDFRAYVLFEKEGNSFRLWTRDGCWPVDAPKTCDKIDFFALVREHMVPGSHVLIYRVGFEGRWGHNCRGICIYIEALRQDGRWILLDIGDAMRQQVGSAGW